MKSKVLKIVKTALSNAEDDLYRAEVAFRGLTEEDMNMEYGQSGKTRQRIIDGYQACAEERKACVEWVESIK